MRSLKRLALLAGLAALLAAPIARGAELSAAPSHLFLFALHGEVREPGHVPIPPPEGELEDACGVAVDSEGDIYVSDYYHREIDVFSPGRGYLTQIADPDPDGPCGLAVDSAGNVYVDNWRRDVVRYAPSSYPPTESTRYGAETTIDFPTSAGARSTGVALDPATGDLYVDERTDVAVFDPAALVEAEPQPSRTFGLGALGQGYGVAVSDFGPTAGDVYVPDATTNTVKVFDSSGFPAGEIDGAGTPQGGFRSLADSAVAVDPSDGHVFVADNLEPGFESPAAAIDEFNAAGDYRGQLPHSFVDAEPSALAVDGSGGVYATSGNSEGAALLGFGPTFPGEFLEVARSGGGEGTVISEPAGIDCGEACAAEYDSGEEVVLTALPAPGSAFAAWSGCEHPSGGRCRLTLGAAETVGAQFEALPGAASISSGTAGAAAAPLAAAPLGPPAPGRSRAARGGRAGASEIAQQGKLRVAVSGRLAPQRLPRNGLAPIAVSLGGKISTTDASPLPQLRALRIELNRHGRLEDEGLPVCPAGRIRIATSARALAACRGALVGQGSFDANIVLRDQKPYPTTGRLLVFNGREGGRPVLLGQIYAAKPFATSFVIVFQIHHRARGEFGAVLTASLPEALGNWGYVTAIDLKLSRRYSYRGRRRSYLSAGCPAPAGFPGALFPLARTSFSFAGGTKLTSTLIQSCRAR